MSLPYFNLYPSDFQAKTYHLTLEEVGAYNRLLMLCWMSPGCSLPFDEKWLMRRLVCDQETYTRVVLVVIEEFFIKKGGRISSPRLAREFEKSRVAHDERVRSGKKGGLARALKNNDKNSSLAKAQLKQPEPEPEPYNNTTSVVLEKVPKVTSTPKNQKFKIPNDWVPSEKNKDYAKDLNLTEDEIREIGNEFQAYWSDRGERRSENGWNQSWQGNCRRIAPQYQRNRGMADQSYSGGGDQTDGLAGAYLRSVRRNKI